MASHRQHITIGGPMDGRIVQDADAYNLAIAGYRDASTFYEGEHTLHVHAWSDITYPAVHAAGQAWRHELRAASGAAILPPVPDPEESTVVQTVLVPERHDQPPVLGEVVKCGHVGATWTVASVIDTGEDVRSDLIHDVTQRSRRLFHVTLEPISPHEVPVSFPVRELMLPVTR